MDKDVAGENQPESDEIPLNARELRAVQRGVAATIMPVAGGWKVQYVTGLDFEDEHGTTYSQISEAVEAIIKMLPLVNSEEGRARAREMEERLWLQLEEELGGREQEEPPQR